MSAATLRAVIAGVLGFHGIGHLMGAMPGLGLIPVHASSPSWLRRWSGHSWLLDGLLGEATARVLGVALYLVAFACSAGAALALLGWLVPHASWRALATASALVSLAAVALYWSALILFFPHKVGALSADVAVLVCLLALNWPTETALGY